MKTKIFALFFAFTCIFWAANIQAQQREGGPSKDPNSYHSPATINVDPMTPPTATDLVEMIIGGDLTYSNVVYTGTAASAGFFNNGNDAGLDIESGIMLSSGTLLNALGPNTNTQISADLGLPGDADLTALAGYATLDATVLEFDFVPTRSIVYVAYIFASDEYNEWVGSQYNDVFAFFLDGINIALIPSTAIPVAINNVNNGSYPVYYNDNAFWPVAPYDLECDGFTTRLVATKNITPNVTHHIKFAIADASDHYYDSWVFIQAASFGGTNPETPLSNWALIVAVVLIGSAIAFRYWRISR